MKAVEESRNNTIQSDAVSESNKSKNEIKKPTGISIQANSSITPYKDKERRRISESGKDEKTNPAFDFGSS